MGLLSEDTIQNQLASMDGWTFEHNAIHKSLKFDSYMAGINLSWQQLLNQKTIIQIFLLVGVKWK